MSKPDQASPGTPEKKEADFFDIPVHIIPPGAKFKRRPHKKKAVTKPKKTLPLKKPKEEASTKVESPRIHRQRRYEETGVQSRDGADDPFISASNQLFPAPKDFTVAFCPCCRDRNLENLRQLAQRSCVRPFPQYHHTPVDYSRPNFTPSSSEIRVIFERKRVGLPKHPNVDPVNTLDLKCVTEADARYVEAMKKLARSVEKFSISEPDTPVKPEKINTPKGDLNS